MKNKIYVTCSVCGKNYVANIWGHKLYPRKHKRVIPHSNNMGLTIMPGRKETCPGSHIGTEIAPMDGQEEKA